MFLGCVRSIQIHQSWIPRAPFPNVNGALGIRSGDAWIRSPVNNAMNWMWRLNKCVSPVNIAEMRAEKTTWLTPLRYDPTAGIPSRTKTLAIRGTASVHFLSRQLSVEKHRWKHTPFYAKTWARILLTFRSARTEWLCQAFPRTPRPRRDLRSVFGNPHSLATRIWSNTDPQNWVNPRSPRPRSIFTVCELFFYIQQS